MHTLLSPLLSFFPQRLRARSSGVRAAAVPQRIGRRAPERGHGACHACRIGAFLPRLRQGPVRSFYGYVVCFVPDFGGYLHREGWHECCLFGCQVAHVPGALGIRVDE